LFIFILRAHNYERFPSPNHLDEQLYALSGIYLVETGVPVSWSTLDYPKSAEVYKGDNILSRRGAFCFRNSFISLGLMNHHFFFTGWRDSPSFPCG